MPIFVTPLSRCLTSFSWPYRQEAFLLSMVLQDLYAFRQEHSIRSGPILWSARNTPYFRLAPHQREHAIVNGAIEITPDDFVQLCDLWHARSEAALARMLQQAPGLAARLRRRPVPA